MDTNLSREGKKELVTVIIDAINDDRLTGKSVSDLHQECFNTDYFIIGYWAAEEWLKNHYGIFAAMETIKYYEQSNFGECTTDLSSSEKVVNMLVYILGEELISELDVISDNWDNELTEKLLKKLKKELTNLL